MRFMKGDNTTIVKISPKNIIAIRNILRDLGLNTSLRKYVSGNRLIFIHI